MAIDEIKECTLGAGKGFGGRSNEARYEEEKRSVPEQVRKAGAYLKVPDPDGEMIRVRVAEVRDETVLLDQNHPLAGKTLHFKLKVLDFKDPA